MKAMTATRYGGPEVMELQDVPVPEVGEGDVLVAVRATTLQALDWHLLRADPAMIRLREGLRRPKRHIHGVDIAGTVAAVGDAVDDLAPGDEVFGWGPAGGGLAEFVCVPRDHVRPKPDALSFEEAGAVGVAAFTALTMVQQKAEVTASDRVLIVGASSGVGHYAVQLCKAAGAHVTAVCSTRNLEFARRVGADEVIDRLVDDWSTMDRSWDVVLQVTGSVPYRRAKRVLAGDGRYAIAGVNQEGRWFGPMRTFLPLMASERFDDRLHVVHARETADDLATLAALADAGSLRPVIDRRFPLADAAAAMRYVEEGRATGKVVVTV